MYLRGIFEPIKNLTDLKIAKSKLLPVTQRMDDILSENDECKLKNIVVKNNIDSNVEFNNVSFHIMKECLY